MDVRNGMALVVMGAATLLVSSCGTTDQGLAARCESPDDCAPGLACVSTVCVDPDADTDSTTDTGAADTTPDTGTVDAPTESVAIHGIWEGDWQGGTVNGAMTMGLEPYPDGGFYGPVVIDGNPCLNDAQVRGYVGTDHVVRAVFFDMRDDPEDIDVDAVVNDVAAHADDESYLGSMYTHVIAATGFYAEDGESVFLNYTIAEWSFCDGAQGTFSLTRQ